MSFKLLENENNRYDDLGKSHLKSDILCSVVNRMNGKKIDRQEITQRCTHSLMMI